MDLSKNVLISNTFLLLANPCFRYTKVLGKKVLMQRNLYFSNLILTNLMMMMMRNWVFFCDWIGEQNKNFTISRLIPYIKKYNLYGLQELNDIPDSWSLILGEWQKCWTELEKSEAVAHYCFLNTNWNLRLEGITGQ